jgi:hypothetical protein
MLTVVVPSVRPVAVRPPPKTAKGWVRMEFETWPEAIRMATMA